MKLIGPDRWQWRRHPPDITAPTIPATCARCGRDALAPIHWPPAGRREGLLELLGLLGPPRPGHPAPFTAYVVALPPVGHPDTVWERCAGPCGGEYAYPHLCRAHRLCGLCHPPMEEVRRGSE